MKFDIFVDSSANLTEKMIEDYSIKVIPYVCMCNGKEVVCYENGIPFSKAAEEFYTAMSKGAEVSTYDNNIFADKRNKPSGEQRRTRTYEKISRTQNLCNRFGKFRLRRRSACRSGS